MDENEIRREVIEEMNSEIEVIEDAWREKVERLEKENDELKREIRELERELEKCDRD